MPIRRLLQRLASIAQKSNARGDVSQAPSKFRGRDFAILGAPAAVCFYLFLLKHDEENLAPIRRTQAEETRRRAAEQKAS